MIILYIREHFVLVDEYNHNIGNVSIFLWCSNFINLRIYRHKHSDRSDPDDNAIISGNTTGGNATGGNAIGLIPHVDTPSGPDRGGH